MKTAAVTRRQRPVFGLLPCVCFPVTSTITNEALLPLTSRLAFLPCFKCVFSVKQDLFSFTCSVPAVIFTVESQMQLPNSNKQGWRGLGVGRGSRAGRMRCVVPWQQQLIPKSVSRPGTLRKLSLYAVSKALLLSYPRLSFQLHSQKPDVLGLQASQAGA